MDVWTILFATLLIIALFCGWLVWVSRFVWESKDFVKASSASKGRTQNKGTEILVMNYKK